MHKTVRHLHRHSSHCLILGRFQRPSWPRQSRHQSHSVHCLHYRKLTPTEPPCELDASPPCPGSTGTRGGAALPALPGRIGALRSGGQTHTRSMGIPPVCTQLGRRSDGGGQASSNVYHCTSHVPLLSSGAIRSKSLRCPKPVMAMGELALEARHAKLQQDKMSGVAPLVCRSLRAHSVARLQELLAKSGVLKLILSHQRGNRKARRHCLTACAASPKIARAQWLSCQPFSHESWPLSSLPPNIFRSREYLITCVFMSRENMLRTL